MGCFGSKPFEIEELRRGILMIHGTIRRQLHFAERQTAYLIEHEGERASTIPDFCDWAGYMFQLIHVHHHGEDELVFPWMNEHLKETTKHFEDDHKELVPLLERATKFFADLPKDPSTENLREAHRQMVEIERLLFPHLKHEEDVVTVELLSRVPAAEVERLNQIVSKHGKDGVANPPKGLPSFYYFLTDEYRARIDAELPWVLRNVIMPYVWKSTYSPHIRFYYNPPAPAVRSPLHDEPYAVTP